MAQIVKEQFARMGLPEVVLADWVRDEADFPPSFTDVGHPTGATRISTDPAKGVVDANCEVHGVEGLFISGTSVFPTAAHCNPTQTIVTMAIRLADHLKARAAAKVPPRVEAAQMASVG
jgi:choline dehydrogenase-like flavoprotein